MSDDIAERLFAERYRSSAIVVPHIVIVIAIVVVIVLGVDGASTLGRERGM